MDRVDCTVFEDQLDALVRGALPEDGVAQLLGHASECPECAALLRVQEHLVSPSLEELEAQVPDAWVDSMHAQVQGALKERRIGGRVRFGWAVPTLAAATVALLLANGITLRALGRMQLREQDLTAQVLDQQRRLVTAGISTERGGPSAFAVRSTPLGSLDMAGGVTVADLRVLLGDIPAGTPVISANRARALATSRFVPSAWRAALARRDGGGDVTAGDLLGVLDELDLSPGTTVPAERLFELLS